MAIFEFKLPELGEGIHEGEVVKWLVKAGDIVEEEQVIVEIQNDKAVVEVPSPVNGKVKEVVVSEGTVSVVGDTLITFEVEGEVPQNEEEPQKEKTVADEKKSNIEENGPVVEKEAVEKDTQAKAPAVANKKVLATPSVRKFARDIGVEITQVNGAGPNGRITREDVQSFQSGEQEVQGDDVPTRVAGEGLEERVALKGIRKVIAQAMAKSVYTAPHVTIMDEVDVTKLVQLREEAKPLAEKKGTKLTYLPFIVKALVAGLRQFPDLNASIDDEKEEIIFKKYYHIGIATDIDKGLIVPVVFDADRKNMWQIAEEIRDLATRGREGKLSSAELKGSTMTITNIGSAGGMFFTPVINYPEVAILGVGRITKKPIERNGEVVIAPIMALSLSIDHRLIDGATAQYFVNYIKQVLEDPQLLILEV